MNTDNKPENPSAFPGEEQSGPNCQGMTLRDYFAAKAMQSYITNEMEVHHKFCAEFAYKIADAMLAERSKP